MAKISELNVRLGLISDPFDRALRKVERDLRNSGQRLSNLGTDLTLAISAPLGAFGAASIKAAGDTEALTLALEAQLGSAEAARKELELLRKEALKPGLGFEQAVKGSVSLQAVGFSADQARETLTNFGNALALAGKGKAELDGVVLALTQISAKGKVSAEEINQIAERLPQIRTLMKQAFGTADTEALQKLGITSAQFIEAINKELVKLPQATGGIKNSIENVGDAINQFLAGIGTEINAAFDLKSVAENIQDSLGGALQWFQRLDDGTKRTIVQFGLLAVALGPAIKLYGVFKTTLAEGVGIYGDIRKGLQNVALGASQTAAAFRSLNLATKAFVLVGVAVAIYSALDAMGAFTRELTAAEKAQMSVAAITRQATEDVSKERVQVNELVRVIKDQNTSRAEQEKALRALQSLAPAQFQNLTIEAAKTGELDKAVNAYIDSLLRAAKAKRAFARLEEIDKLRESLSELSEPDLFSFETVKNAFLSAGNSVGFTALQANSASKQFVKLRDELNKEEEALRGVIKENGDFVETIKSAGKETNNFGNAVGAAGDGLTKKMQTALAAVNANLTAFDEKLKLYGPSAENAAKRNDLLAASIDRLLKAGLPATSEQVQKLKDELLSSAGVTDAMRAKYEALGTSAAGSADKAGKLADATGRVGDELSAGIKTAVAEVTAALADFDRQVATLGPSAENASKRNDLLAASIDRLLKAGLPATSKQVQKLKDELLSSAGVTDAMRAKYEALGTSAGSGADQAKQLAAATAAVSAEMSAGIQTAIAETSAQIAAFDARMQEYGPTAENAEKRNDLLAKSIDRLLKAGFSATSAEVQKLKDELAASTSVTDAAKESYRQLREEWSKPVSIEAAPVIPQLPQANPLGVGGPEPSPEQAATPGFNISVGALNEGLVAINALTLGLQTLVTTGLTPAQAILQGLQNDTLNFTEAFNAMTADVNANGTVMQQIALGLGQSFQDAANSGATSFSDFAREFIKSAAKIIRTQIQIAVTNAALSALQSTPYPYNLILAGIAGAAAGSLFQALVNKIAAPKLAKGGVIDRPTFALLGEYPGAGSNPEIAAPESKLRSIFRSEQGGGGPMEVYGIIRGGDIHISNQKAQRDRSRIR